MRDPSICPDCHLTPVDVICDGCGRFSFMPFIGLLVGVALFLAALFGFWCITP